MRNFGDIGRGGEEGDLGSPGLVPGVRATPNRWEPTPNGEPAGANTGAPPRTRFFSMPVPPATSEGAPVQLVAPTPENRVVIITPPAVGFTIFVGDAGVSPKNGTALTPGLNYEVILPGLQALYAVTNAPVYLRVNVQVAIVLAAERQRETDGI